MAKNDSMAELDEDPSRRPLAGVMAQVSLRFRVAPAGGGLALDEAAQSFFGCGPRLDALETPVANLDVLAPGSACTLTEWLLEQGEAADETGFWNLRCEGGTWLGADVVHGRTEVWTLEPQGGSDADLSPLVHEFRNHLSTLHTNAELLSLLVAKAGDDERLSAPAGRISRRCVAMRETLEAIVTVANRGAQKTCELRSALHAALSRTAWSERIGLVCDVEDQVSDRYCTQLAQLIAEWASFDLREGRHSEIRIDRSACGEALEITSRGASDWVQSLLGHASADADDLRARNGPALQLRRAGLASGFWRRNGIGGALIELER